MSRHKRPSTIIKDGFLEKWTNYVGAWQPRYFIIEPGVLKYADSRGQRIKETIPLSVCKTRSSLTDPLRLEVEHPRGTLHIRVATADIRKAWIDALQTAQNMFHHQALMVQRASNSDPSSSSPPKPLMSQPSSDIEEEADLFEDEQDLPFSTDITSVLELIDKLLLKLREDRETLEESIQRRLEQCCTMSPTEYLETLGDLQKCTSDIIEGSLRSLTRMRAATTDALEERKALQHNIRSLARQKYTFQQKLKSISLLLKSHSHSSQSLSSEVTPGLSRHVKSQIIQLIQSDDTSEAANSTSDDDDGRRASEEFFDAEDVPESSKDTEGVTSVAQSVIRRGELPKKRTEITTSLWSILKDCTGKELDRISIPVEFNEPTSFLQRLAEDFQYCALLKQASLLEDESERFLHVAVFSVSPFASAVGRTYKPFNPLLGETYELTHRGFKFIAEQVGHHPPVSAYHVSSPEFCSWGHLRIQTRFTGKSVELSLPGPVHILLNTCRHPLCDARNTSDEFLAKAKMCAHNDHYTYQRCKALIRNVIFGKISFELIGSVVITNHSTGAFAVIEFPKSYWWNKESSVVNGVIYDSQGWPKYRLGGYWNREIWAEKVTPSLYQCRQAPALVLTPSSASMPATQSSPGKLPAACCRYRAALASAMGRSHNDRNISLGRLEASDASRQLRKLLPF